MNILENGVMSYDNRDDLIYAIFQEMNIIILPDGCLYDNDTNSDISFQGKLLKAPINLQDSRYASESEVIFDPFENIKQVSTLFGYYLDKLSKLEDINVIAYYPTEVPVEGYEYNKTTITIKFESPNQPLLVTQPYFNKCLSLIEAIFIISGDAVDLSQLDSIDAIASK